MRRLIPLAPKIDLASRRGRFGLRSRLRDAARYVFAIDLYSHLRESHPETHVGYWVFPLPEGEAESTFGIDLTSIGSGSIWRERPGGGREAAVDSWSNPAYVFDPVIGIQLVLRREGQVVENRFVTATVADPQVLRSFYHRVHAGHGYTPAEPFLFELHAAMLRKLERIFGRHIAPRARVLDAGCGRSLFTEIRADWPFRLIAADVDHDLLRARRAQFPGVHWLVGDASPLPFREAVFDVVFAGELIEHLPEPRLGLAEFRRVLRRDGRLILTTPNRLRLANLADGSERPYSPDHLSELSYDEARERLAEAGFEILETTGLHLELLLNWFSPLPKLDRLQRSWNRRWAVPLMRPLLAAGALVPRYAVDLIFVARRAPA